MGCLIKIGCEEFIFIINIETRLDLGKKRCRFMIFKLDFQLRPFWPFWSWNSKIFKSVNKQHLMNPKMQKNTIICYWWLFGLWLAFATFVGLFSFFWHPWCLRRPVVWKKVIYKQYNLQNSFHFWHAILNHCDIFDRLKSCQYYNYIWEKKVIDWKW